MWTYHETVRLPYDATHHSLRVRGVHHEVVVLGIFPVLNVFDLTPDGYQSCLRDTLHIYIYTYIYT